MSSIRGVGTVLSDFDGVRSIFLADKPYGLGDETVSERNAAENGTIIGAAINVNEQFTSRRYSFVYDGWYLEEKDVEDYIVRKLLFRQTFYYTNILRHRKSTYLNLLDACV